MERLTVSEILGDRAARLTALARRLGSCAEGAAEAIAWARGRSPEKLAAEGAQISSLLAQLAVEARKIGEEAEHV